VLAQGQSGKISAWGGDVLEFELDGKKLVASVENIEGDAPEAGCSTSGRNKGELGALLIALGALLVGRRRRPMNR
jgi:MYXO-CTERM domain-containing protein